MFRHKKSKNRIAMAYEIKACQLSQSIYVEQEGMVAVLPLKNKQ